MHPSTIKKESLFEEIDEDKKYTDSSQGLTDPFMMSQGSVEQKVSQLEEEEEEDDDDLEAVRE